MSNFLILVIKLVVVNVSSGDLASDSASSSPTQTPTPSPLPGQEVRFISRC